MTWECLGSINVARSSHVALGDNSNAPHLSGFDSGLNCCVIAFLAANANGASHTVEKNLAIPDFSRICSIGNSVDSLFNRFIREDQFQLDLREQINVVFAPPEYLRMAFLATVTANLGDGHSFDAQLDQSTLDRFELVGTNDSFNLGNVFLAFSLWQNQSLVTLVLPDQSISRQ
jgi:hypothetical protein